MPTPSHENVVGLVVTEIQTMADVCRAVDPATPVPTCPEWTLAELIRHTGTIHRWAATMVERLSPERLGRRDLELDRPDDDAALADWLAAGATFVAERFARIDPSAEMWAWGWPKTAAFWPRRMLHETGIHRADAELAVGMKPRYDPEIAADGIDELLADLPHAAYFAPAVSELKGTGEVLSLVAHDVGERWDITLGPDGFAWRRLTADGDDDDDGHTTVRAPVAELLLMLYRRRPVVGGEVTGDRSLLERWLANSAL